MLQNTGFLVSRRCLSTALKNRRALTVCQRFISPRNRLKTASPECLYRVSSTGKIFATMPAGLVAMQRKIALSTWDESQIKRTLATSTGDSKEKKWSGKGVYFLSVVLAGGAVYLLYSRKSRHNLLESVCQAEPYDAKGKDKLKSPHQGKSPSLQEAIAQATDLCQRVKDESGSPGLVVAVSVDGQPVWAQGLGYADVENRLPCTPDSVMRIASISKSFTMTAVAKAMENGDLDIDKPVQVYVPQFPEKTVNGEKVTVTTRQLVSHLSGIRHYEKDYMKDKSTNKVSDKSSSSSPTPAPSGEKTSEKGLNLLGEYQQDEYFIKNKLNSTQAALALFKDDPLVHKPGTKYLYTTHGWTLVAAVLEGATKKKFPDLVRTLFHDLGLENTYLDENEPLIYNRARFYVRNKKGLLVNSPYVDCSYKYAGGGMLSTVSDLLRFANAMLYSYQYREPEQCEAIQQQGAKTAKSNTNEPSTLPTTSNTQSHLPGYLKHSTVEQIWSPVELTKSKTTKGSYYAMGWQTIPGKQTTGFGQKQHFQVYHTGGAIGASSVILILPAEGDGGHTSGSSPPKGVCVAIIVNMINVRLSRTALKIAKLFEQVSVD